MTSEGTRLDVGAFCCLVSLSQLPLSCLQGLIPLCCLFSGVLGTRRLFAQTETCFSSRTDSQLCFSSARGQPSPGGMVNIVCCSSGLGECPCADRDRAEPRFFVPVLTCKLFTLISPACDGRALLFSGHGCSAHAFPDHMPMRFLVSFIPSSPQACSLGTNGAREKQHQHLLGC